MTAGGFSRRLKGQAAAAPAGGFLRFLKAALSVTAEGFWLVVKPLAASGLWWGGGEEKGCE